MNNQMIKELIDILDRETGIYEDILKISKNKTNTIVEGKVSELENITKLEQSLIFKMGKLETERENVIEKLSKSMNMDPSKMTVSEVVKHIDSEQAATLEDYRGRMNRLVGELKDTNNLNSKLIKNSLDYINFSINILSSDHTGENNYGNKGNVNDSKKKNFFDVKL